MLENRNTLVLYNTAICNLNCKYCYIDKNPILKSIDNILAESYKNPTYYLDFIEEIFPIRKNLVELEIWGGEPTLGLDRLGPLIRLLLPKYLNLNTVMFSTNCTTENCVEQIRDLIINLNTANRPIQLRIQLSLDGPEEINDFNRGKGTTQKFINTFSKLITTIPNILNKNTNINVELFFKPTLGLESINKLQTKQNIINYYKFFESFKTAVNKVHCSQMAFGISIPNVAEPLPVTVEDGKNFAQLCKLTREIEEENKSKFYFKYYTLITPYTYGRNMHQECNRGCCGTGRQVIGLLPNNLISTCHVGFTNLLEEYKKAAELNNNRISSLDNTFFEQNTSIVPMVFPKEKLKDYELQIEEYYTDGNAQFFAIVGEIQFLASVGQINKKYLNFDKAKWAASVILNHSSYCIRNNLNVTGSKQLLSTGLLKLFFNGAEEYIASKDD